MKREEDMKRKKRIRERHKREEEKGEMGKGDAEETGNEREVG